MTALKQNKKEKNIERFRISIASSTAECMQEVSCAASTVATHMVPHRDASILFFSFIYLHVSTSYPKPHTTNHHHSSNHRYLKLFYSSIDSSSASGFFLCLGLVTIKLVSSSANSLL